MPYPRFRLFKVLFMKKIILLNYYFENNFVEMRKKFSLTHFVMIIFLML